MRAEPVEPFQDHLFGSNRNRSIGEANALMGGAIRRDVTPRIFRLMRRRRRSERLTWPFEEHGGREEQSTSERTRGDRERVYRKISLDGLIQSVPHEPEGVTLNPSERRGRLSIALTLDKLFPTGQQKKTKI
jgi:hypothetical protein